MNAYALGSRLAQRALIPDRCSPHGWRCPLTALLAAAWATILGGVRSFATIAP